MKLEHRAIVVTGGASGIGRAMVERFALEGPRGIAVVDRDGAAARAVADRVGGLAVAADLTCEAEAARVIAVIEARYGPIDLCCSNGGIAAPGGSFEVPGDGVCDHWNVAAVLYRRAGNRLSCLRPVLDPPAPSGVVDAGPRVPRPVGTVLDPAAVADIVVEGLRSARFLMLTRPERKERAVVRVTHPDACSDGWSGRYAARCSAVLEREVSARDAS
ncbi:SDR family NAD(P)-dependent oxidoreductase [Actinopolymorpha pittospori]